jgi:hypothetical protein
MDIDHRELDALPPGSPSWKHWSPSSVSSWMASASTWSTASSATTASSLPRSRMLAGATKTWTIGSTSSAATSAWSSAPWSRPPAAGSRPAGRLQLLAGLPAPNHILEHRTRSAHNDLHAPTALPCGDPDRSAAPHVPVVCLLDGLPSLSRSGVKGRCALMSARWAFGPPLTPPRPGWAGDTGRPGWARSSARPAASTRRRTA